MTGLMMPISDGLAEGPDSSLSKTTPWSTSSPSNQRIGNRLRVIRESHGISEKELSEQLAIDFRDLKSYESGERRVSAGLLLRIARLLNVRPEYFFQDFAKDQFLRPLP
jgi:ribosome-binding protein aMBF1 (putative translation factor)